MVFQILKKRTTFCHHMAGFSLVELVVVLFIISTMLFVAIPHFRGSGEGNDNQALVSLIQSLKRSAVKDGRDFFLHLDVVDGRIWVSVDAVDQGTDDAIAGTIANHRAGGESKPLLNLSLKGVEIMNQFDLEVTDAVIHFYSQGYSDMALIQMGEGDQAVTLKISPFLWDVEIVQGHGFFHDCI